LESLAHAAPDGAAGTLEPGTIEVRVSAYVTFAIEAGGGAAR
jgi:hypothetical protein